MTAISYSKIVLSVGMIVFVAAMVVAGTGAFFNDTETATGNTFTAGAIDLKIDSVQHYNGMVCAEETAGSEVYFWVPEADATLDADKHAVMNVGFDAAAYNTLNPAQYPQAGVTCTGSWRLADDNGQPVIGQFWNFTDVKPGDQGENTISVHVDNNDAWMCAAIDNIVDADNSLTEPEEEDPDEVDGLDSGELDSNLQFFAWVDEGVTEGFGDNEDSEGDNVYQAVERPLGFETAANLVDHVWTLAEGGDDPIEGGATGYVGLAWCAGEFDQTAFATDGSLVCNGEAMGNEAQTDSWMADFKFYVEQSRNNDGFTCADAGLLTP